jgi:hypothetical protein
MTTITIDKELLEQVVNKLLTCWPKSDPLVNELRATLATPATAQAAEIERLKTESEERLQNCAALVAEVERLRAAPATTPEQPRPFIPWSKEAEMLESWAAHLSHHKETP